MADGRKPAADDPKARRHAAGQDKDFEAFAGMMQEEEGIDLGSGEDDEHQRTAFKEKSLFKHPLYRDADVYSRDASKFMKQTLTDSEAELEEDEDYQAIDFYLLVIPGKVHRFLCGLYAGKPDEGETALIDAVAQMDLCQAAVRKSRAALKSLLERRPSLRFEITHLTDHLESMLWGIKTLEDDIEAGILPAS